MQQLGAQQVPQTVTAGDTIRFARSLPLFPASAGWQLKYVIVGAAAVYPFAATANGDDYAIDVSATDSSAWAAGAYTLQESVTSADNTERYSLQASALRILPNLANQSQGIDLRTHAQKALAQIEAYIENRTPTTALIMIDGKRLEHYPLEQILAMRDKYRAEVALEQRRAAGKGMPQVRLSFR